MLRYATFGREVRRVIVTKLLTYHPKIGPCCSIVGAFTCVYSVIDI
jgi:hypothetical protein